MKHDQWKCIKCDNEEFEEDQIATTGSFWPKFFNIQNKKFTVRLREILSWFENVEIIFNLLLTKLFIFFISIIQYTQY